MNRQEIAKQLIALAKTFVTADARLVRDLKPGDLIEVKQTGKSEPEKRVVKLVRPINFIDSDGSVRRHQVILFNNGMDIVVDNDATVEFLEQASVLKKLLHMAKSSLA